MGSGDVSKMFRLTLALLGLSSCRLPSVLSACDEISAAVIKEKKFFDSATGRYIPFKGVSYYPRPNAGPLSEGQAMDLFTEEYRHIWERDIVHLKALGVNAVRLYALDSNKNHDGFMCALKSAGIYAIVGLTASCANCSIIAEESAPNCYPGSLKNRGQYIINAFAKFDNVLGFSAGNEVSLSGIPEENAPCQKQFLRDMRAYINNCPTMRQIPVGVVVADVDREDNALYYNCRSDPNDELENAEWYGINVYLHCNGADTQSNNLPGYTALLSSFQSSRMSIPVLLTEFGCINPSFPTIDGFEAQRNFLQVDAIFSPSYAEEFAGGFVFEYSTEMVYIGTSDSFTQHGPGNYGVGYFDPDSCNDIDIPCNYVQYPQFQTLQAAYAAVDDSFVPPLEEFNPEPRGITACPPRYPPLSSFQWESATVSDFGCPWVVSFTCPNASPECVTTPTPAPTANPGTSTVPPGTSSPSLSLSPSSVPAVMNETSTDPPVTTLPSFSSSPSQVPTMMNETSTDPPVTSLPSFSSSPSPVPTMMNGTSTDPPVTSPPSLSLAPTLFPTMMNETSTSATATSPPSLSLSPSPVPTPMNGTWTDPPVTSFPSPAPTTPTTGPLTELPATDSPSSMPPTASFGPTNTNTTTEPGATTTSSAAPSVPTPTPSSEPSVSSPPSLLPTNGSSIEETVEAEDCTDICPGIYPFGCSENEVGVVKYGCNSVGECFYASTLEEDYPSSGFCTFRVASQTAGALSETSSALDGTGSCLAWQVSLWSALAANFFFWFLHMA